MTWNNEGRQAKQVDYCRKWLQGCRRTKTPQVNAYSLKHWLERKRSAEAQPRYEDYYIGEDALLRACELEGFLVRRERLQNVVGASKRDCT